MRKFVVLFLLGAITITWLLDAAAQTETTARLVITLPADAKLYFSGAPTQQTGATRTFATPALQPGKSYVYDLKAEVTRQGKVYSQVQQPTVMAGQTTQVDFATLGTEPAAPPPQSAGDAGWPRKITSDGNSVTIYQPQVEKWEGNRLETRAVATIETKASPEPIFGVIWLAARTDVDKENRLVQLHEIHITKVNFPSAPDKANDYLALFRSLVPQGSRTLSLDRLQANLAVNQAEAQAPKLPLKNDVPRIIFSTKPALLVLIDGKPALRQVDGSDLLRVINTRALIVLDQGSGKNYLHVMNRWMETADLEGSWTVTANPPASLAKVLTKAKENPQIDLMDDVADDLAEDFQNGIIPTIYVSTVPTELLDTRGEPDFAPIEGTKLLWVRNSSDQIIMDTADQNYYVLFSGRWFRSTALKGPWEFVAASKMPAEFAKIPQTHPKGDVLSSVAGTPQAQEAVIANRVPQTAAISRSEAKLSVLYDGAPKFEPIDGTQLQYAVNSPTAVVQTGPTAYYAVENGVWFTAAAPTGPWTAATSVPPAIYAMPPSSPIYYVTNVQVYGSTPEVVYTGYTPGYFGTCYDPDGVIVYGTGWNFIPWVGPSYWFGRPWTYGFGAHFGWTSSGWGFGYGCGWGRPWWGPAGWNAAWGGNAWRPGWNNGMGGRYNNTHINNVNFNNFNAYNRWGNNVHVHQGNTAINASRNTQVNTLNRGFNNTVATKEGDVLRRSGNGWERMNPNGQFQHYDPKNVPANNRPAAENNVNQANRDWQARQAGEANHNAFRSAGGNQHVTPTPHPSNVGGPGGFHGEPGGFRPSYGGGGGRGGRGGRR